MTRKRIFSLFTIFALLLMAVSPVMAQESPPTADTVVANWLPMVALVVLTIGLLGALWLAHEAFKQAGINISPDAIAAIATPIADNLRQQIADARKYAASTTNPLDDAGVSIAAYPLELLLDELQNRGIIVKYVEGEGQPTSTAENEQSVPLI